MTNLSMPGASMRTRYVTAGSLRTRVAEPTPAPSGGVGGASAVHDPAPSGGSCHARGVRLADLATKRRCSFLSGPKQVGDVGKSQRVAGSSKGELDGAVCEQHRLRYNRTDCYLECLFERSELWSSETYYVFDLLGFFLIKGLWLLKAGLRERPATAQEYNNHLID